MIFWIVASGPTMFADASPKVSARNTVGLQSHYRLLDGSIGVAMQVSGYITSVHNTMKLPTCIYKLKCYIVLKILKNYLAYSLNYLKYIFDQLTISFILWIDNNQVC